MSFYRNMKDIFQESGEYFQNAAYFAINVVNKCIHRQDELHIAVYYTLFLPPKYIAKTFTHRAS